MLELCIYWEAAGLSLALRCSVESRVRVAGRIVRVPTPDKLDVQVQTSPRGAIASRSIAHCFTSASQSIIAKMRPTLRALANYLEPGTPTGLTGLWTHKTPRSTLLYLYNTTLNRLQSIPETSLYRQSVEATTKHRMSLVEKVVPPGYEEWTAKARELMRKYPHQFEAASDRADGSGARAVKYGNRVFVVGIAHEAGDVRVEEWNGESQVSSSDVVPDASEHQNINDVKLEWEEEPQLTAEQVKELEQQLGAGLIEEVIQVAEGELQLIDTMEKAQVWENLEEKPAPGQWTYFERQTS
ncbi:ETC complex I subunit conserved region domain-containing protein [Trichoderma longibrachiatum]